LIWVAVVGKREPVDLPSILAVPVLGLDDGEETLGGKFGRAVHIGFVREIVVVVVLMLNQAALF
jgi:hypothetical protein